MYNVGKQIGHGSETSVQSFAIVRSWPPKSKTTRQQNGRGRNNTQRGILCQLRFLKNAHPCPLETGPTLSPGVDGCIAEQLEENFFCFGILNLEEKKVSAFHSLFFAGFGRQKRRSGGHLGLHKWPNVWFQNNSKLVCRAMVAGGTQTNVTAK